MNFLKNIKILFLLCALSAGIAFQSCRDESNDFRIDTDGTVIALRIPDVEDISFDTRADEDELSQSDSESTSTPTTAEGRFNSLWLFAFPQNSEGNKLVVRLSDLTYTTEGRYRVYRTNITPGKYKFYLFANLDGENGYLSSGENGYFVASSAASEDNLNSIRLDFSTNRPIAGRLPMVAFPTNIDNATDGVFEVIAEITNQVNVNMKFLCAKVRHTILFDNTPGGISSSFQNSIIEFGDKATVSNMLLSTPIYNESNGGNSNDVKWDVNYTRYEYPDNENYPRNGSDNLYAWDSDNDGDWITSGRKAWQYIAYVPEDLNGETLFSHPYSIGGVALNEPKTFTMKQFYENRLKEDKEIRRSQMYDVVSKITKSDFSDWETIIHLEDWDLNTINYYFHGPYELIVEDTGMDIVRTGGWETLGFQSNVSDNEIYFEYPQIVIDGKSYDFFKAQVVTPGMSDDEGGTYVFDDNWQSHFRIHVNPEIPYNVLKSLQEIKDESGNVIGGGIYTNNEGVEYKLDEMKYFHIVAANLHKRIDIRLLEMDVFLNVSPQIITIDSREYYTNGLPDNEIEIFFNTNFVDANLSQYFTLTDSDELIIGKGVNGTSLDLKLDSGSYDGGSGNIYGLKVSNGKVTLNVYDFFNGDPFWNEENEFTFTFRLEVPNSDIVIEKPVRVLVKPFTTNYTIHFRDNTRDWEEPHIYVYQLLTLPSDLGKGIGSDGVERDNTHLAGKIVGYIENNNGLQWNGAVQYVFSNNTSFRGWKGYGGPDINNPWDEATITYDNPTDANNGNNSTMGFVMFGKAPDNNPTPGCWNYTYAYNYTYGLTENSKRWERYNYNVNFNEDHERGVERNSNLWPCNTCKDLKRNHDYNGGDDRRFYTGISMEREADGWWKYTLSGVAQPGRTMIIFANYHEPWPPAHGQYTPEDNRWPGDYESGLPLFDFEDNEGWFLFDGNTSNSDQKFYDEKPTTGVIPHTFTSPYYSNDMRIEVRKPLSGNVNSIEVNSKTYSDGTDSGNNVYFTVPAGDLQSFLNNGSTSSFKVKVNASGTSKEYILSPKNFRRNGTSGYVTAQPLYLEFNNELLLFVKWNDHTTGQGYEPGNGTNTLIVNWGDGVWMKDVPVTAKEYGNYKFVNFYPDMPSGSGEKIQVKLNEAFVKEVKVEDLPTYYIPSKNPFISNNLNGYYKINVHNL